MIRFPWHAGVLLVWALLGAGCHDSSPPVTEEGPPPETSFYPEFVPIAGTFPFPSDLLFAGSTDGTLNIPVPYYLTAPSAAEPTAPLTDFWTGAGGSFLNCVDAGDPINYAESIAQDRGLLFVEVVGGNSSPPDQVVPNDVYAKMQAMTSQFLASDGSRLVVTDPSLLAPTQ